MSIVSPAQRSVSSSSGTKPKVVRFQLSYNLKDLLLDFVTEKDRKLYEELVCHIRDVGQEIRDDDLVQLLREARGCASILDGNLRLFVQVVLILKWTHRSKEVVSEYQGFLLDLCTAHNYYTKLVIEHLVNSFKCDTDSSQWEDCIPSTSEEKCIQHIHEVIKAILSVIPMSREVLLASIVKNYPYLKKPAHEHEAYIYNLLKIISYAPSLHPDILKLIIDKIIAVDVYTPRSELEEMKRQLEASKAGVDSAMEVDEGNIFQMDVPDKDKSLSYTLDLCMTMMFRCLNNFCRDEERNFIWDKAKILYGIVVKIFENVILPTHAVHHTQFIIFYLLSFKPALALSFLQMLWKKVTNPNIAPVIRQSTVFYIASLLARANYISIHVVQEKLSEIAGWVHSYIDCQDGNVGSHDTRVHGVFYAACQAMFYVIAFRYKELVNSQKGLMFLQTLNLGKIVTCRLNPLKACQPAVVSNFAAIARAYQLVYCYTIIERNSRSNLPQIYRDVTGATISVNQTQLDSFFPFDPYLLQKSFSFIEPIYRDYTEQPAEIGLESEQSQRDEDIDDFLEAPPINDTTSLSNFSYGTSPGFLHM